MDTEATTISIAKVEKKSEDILPDVNPTDKVQTQQSISPEVYAVLSDLTARISKIEKFLNI